ncbi:hypothetical protein COV18_00430 [Candidatus Woesearchaeota archaeon CG10_big_fil_rev_8_21_14_0_10_37_12]|nr:MAG: hypothetical protein COV18_00430 [Candidatus Woesearchaeota archaeon CG10_big_fil_rev_8_21_14_0_10_37_12]
MAREGSIMERYHPVNRFLLKPLYGLCGGRENPLVAEGITGAVNYVFHTGLFFGMYKLSDSLVGSQEFFNGDLERMIFAATVSLVFPIVHGKRAIEKRLYLRRERTQYSALAE